MCRPTPLLPINGFVALLGPAVEEAIGLRISEAADADAVILDLRNKKPDVASPAEQALERALHALEVRKRLK